MLDGKKMKIERIAPISPECYYAGQLQYRFSIGLLVSVLLMMSSIPFGSTSSSIGLALFVIAAIAFLIGLLPMGIHSWVVWWRVLFKKSDRYDDEPAIKWIYVMCNPVSSLVFSFACAFLLTLAGVKDAANITHSIWLLFVVFANISGSVVWLKYRKMKKWTK